MYPYTFMHVKFCVLFKREVEREKCKQVMNIVLYKNIKSNNLYTESSAIAVLNLDSLVYNAVMCQKDADGMVNSVDPDQTAFEEQSDLGLLCLHILVCPNS